MSVLDNPIGFVDPTTTGQGNDQGDLTTQNADPQKVVFGNPIGFVDSHQATEPEAPAATTTAKPPKKDYTVVIAIGTIVVLAVVFAGVWHWSKK